MMAKFNLVNLQLSTEVVIKFLGTQTRPNSNALNTVLSAYSNIFQSIYISIVYSRLYLFQNNYK